MPDWCYLTAAWRGVFIHLTPLTTLPCSSSTRATPAPLCIMSVLQFAFLDHLDGPFYWRSQLVPQNTLLAWKSCSFPRKLKALFIINRIVASEAIKVFLQSQNKTRGIGYQNFSQWSLPGKGIGSLLFPSICWALAFILGCRVVSSKRNANTFLMTLRSCSTSHKERRERVGKKDEFQYSAAHQITMLGMSDPFLATESTDLCFTYWI